MKTKLLSLLFLFLVHFAAATDFLTIGNVQTTWTTQKGSIDKATMYIEPKGFYAECQLVLDFSVNCTNFTNPSDSLEISMQFSLPAAAEVTDLWLWIYGEPVQAGIYDRWTATQIYEEIVSRRKDPALLTKLSATSYSLKIFPLQTNLPRKVKMTFLLPISNLLSAKTQMVLPLNILKLSKCPLDSITVLYKPKNYLLTPSLLEPNQSSFNWNIDTEYGACYKSIIPNDNSLTTLTLELSKPTAQNNFIGQYKYLGSDSGIYQLELNVGDIINIQPAKKVLFLVDFIKSNSDVSSNFVLNSLKDYVRINFKEGDSISFMFPGFFTNAISSKWLSADSNSLNQILQNLDTTLMSQYSNFAGLAMDAIDFIRSNGNGGHIQLISSSSEFSTPTAANSQLNNIMDFMGNPKIPFHAISLNEKGTMYYASSSYFKGNDYLYSQLCSLTGGEYQTLYSPSQHDDCWWNYTATFNTIDKMFENSGQTFAGYFSSLEIQINTQGGYTYSSYPPLETCGFFYFDSRIRQIGRYKGGFPLEVLLKGITPEGTEYNFTQIISDSLADALDQSAEKILEVYKINNLLGQVQSTEVIPQIVRSSIKQRILTSYTAFLALEVPLNVDEDTLNLEPDPGTTTEKPEEVLRKVEEYIDFRIFPNPVKDALTFDFELSQKSLIAIEIISVFGERIIVHAEREFSKGKHVLHIDVKDLAAGIYFAKITTSEGSKFQKIVKI